MYVCEWMCWSTSKLETPTRWRMCWKEDSCVVRGLTGACPFFLGLEASTALHMAQELARFLFLQHCAKNVKLGSLTADLDFDPPSSLSPLSFRPFALQHRQGSALAVVFPTTISACGQLPLFQLDLSRSILVQRRQCSP